MHWMSFLKIKTFVHEWREIEIRGHLFIKMGRFVQENWIFEGRELINVQETEKFWPYCKEKWIAGEKEEIKNQRKKVDRRKNTTRRRKIQFTLIENLISLK